MTTVFRDASIAPLGARPAPLSLSNPLARWLAARGVHYGWAAVAATFLLMLATAGAMGSAGVIILPLEKEFGWSAADISTALALRIAFYGLMGRSPPPSSTASACEASSSPRSS